MITYKSRTKRSYQQMLKETVESPIGFVEMELTPVSFSHHKKKFKYAATSRVNEVNEEDVTMLGQSYGIESRPVSLKAAAQSEKIKGEIDKYRSEVFRMNSAIKYCPCDESKYC